ncbi:hypothetical protein PG989_003832 [Apiospora arundinis]
MANLLNFPSFSLNLEEKFSGQIEIDNLITEARSIIKRARYPAAHDNSQALEVLDEAITLAKDLRQEDTVDEDENDEDQDKEDAATRLRALGHSLAEANLLRGHILRAMGDIPAACEAYREAISRSPDVFPPSNTYTALTSSSSPSSSRSSSKKDPSSLLSPYETLRPSTSSGPSTSFSQPARITTTRSSSVRHHHPKRQTAAKQAWKAIVKLSPPRGQDDLTSTYPPAPSSPEGAFVRRKSAPSNDAAMSREDKRRAGVWDAGYHPVHVDSPGCPLSPSLDESHRAMVDQCLEQLQRETKLDVPIQNVWAQKKVSIVESSSSSSDGDASDSSSASVASERSIQHKKKCGDLWTQAQEPRRRR